MCLTSQITDSVTHFWLGVPANDQPERVIWQSSASFLLIQFLAVLFLFLKGKNQFDYA